MSTFASQSIYGDHELIQAMPLNTARTHSVTISAASPSATITLSDSAKLAEVHVIDLNDSADVVYVEMSDLPGGSPKHPLASGKNTYTIVTLSRDLTVSLELPSFDASFKIFVMEA